MEADFAEHGWDYRDRYLPGGGPSRLTTRRLLLLVDQVLPRGSSRFWCAVLDRDPLTDEQVLLSDLYGVWAGKPHPIRTRREDAEKRRKTAAKKARIAKRERRRRRMKTH